MTRVCVPRAALALAVLAMSGCSDNNPIAPSFTPQAETFSGTVAQKGTVDHQFIVTDDGPITVTVLAVAREVPIPPDIPTDTSAPPGIEDQPASLPAPIYVGLGLGTWDGTTCSLLAQRTNASLLTSISGTAISGRFCVSVFDSGSVTDPVDYLLEVDHT